MRARAASDTGRCRMDLIQLESVLNYYACHGLHAIQGNSDSKCDSAGVTA